MLIHGHMAIWFPWCFLRSTVAPLQWQLCNVCDVWWLCHCQVHCALTRSCNSHATDPSLFPQWHLCQDLLETRNNLVTLETPNSPNIQRLNNFWNNWLKQVETLFHVVSSFKWFDMIWRYHWVALSFFELLWTPLNSCVILSPGAEWTSERPAEPLPLQHTASPRAPCRVQRTIGSHRDISWWHVMTCDDMWWQLVWFVKSLPLQNVPMPAALKSSAPLPWAIEVGDKGVRQQHPLAL